MRIDLAPDDDIAALVRAEKRESLVVVILPRRDPLAQTLAAAAVGPLAVECAPKMRLNAVLAGGEHPATDAAVAYLESATSTTGQVLRLS